MSFPERVYTDEEFNLAKELVDQGYKHNLKIEGSPEFVQKMNQVLDLIKTAGYYDFLQTYIRSIMEIDGITQLREAEVAIWVSAFALRDTVDAASLLVQKAYHMKEYLEGELYYGGSSETRTIAKRMEFLQVLMEKTSNASVKADCERLLEMWKDSTTAF